jgi:hypothetical protein
VSVAAAGLAWPGAPLVSLVDDRTAVIASRQGSDVRGHWTSSPVLVAAARLAFSRA